MTSPRRFEQDLPAMLVDLYLAGTPDYRDDLFQQTARVRQRPAWTFPERWLPMDVVTRPVSTPAFPWRQIGVLALIGLILAAAAAVYVGSQPDLPAPFGLAKNGVVVYTKDGDILARDTIDGAPRPLVATAAHEMADSLSPRGTYVLAVRPHGEDSIDLAVAPVAGGESESIGGPYVNPGPISWSPDETRIAVSHEVGGYPTITIVNVDGTGDRDLDLGMPADSAAWRPPDGSQLSFRGEVDGNSALFLANGDGTDPVQLDVQRDLLEAPYEVLAPAWSPNGDQLAFHRLVLTPGNGNGNGFRIHVVDLDRAGALTTQKTFEFDAESDDEFNVSWLPTGDELLFTRHDVNLEHLSIARLADGAVARDVGETITTGGYGMLRYTITPDGRTVFARSLDDGTEWVVDPSSGSFEPADFGSEDLIWVQRRAE